MIEEKNAKITGTFFGIEDHGILQFYIYLDYESGAQGFGGYVLDEPVFSMDFDDLHEFEKKKGGRFVRRRGTAAGLDSILKILEVLGVDKWEALSGTPCRVRSEQSKVHSIGHYLKDRWFSWDEHFKEWGIDTD
jgi:hypothetical protein